MNVEADITKFVKAMDRDIGLVLRLIALDVRNMIVQNHPVDTGYSRSQWRLSVGEPDLTVDDPPTRRGTRSVVPAPRADLGALSGVNAQSEIFIANSVHYVQYLEEGSSAKAPNGMVAISLAAAKDKIDSYTREAHR